MRIDGMWLICDDRMIRPIVTVEVECQKEGWTAFPFLIDTGADRTVFCADLLAQLKPVSGSHTAALLGVGGIASSVNVTVKIRMRQESNTPITFGGEFAAFTDPAALDMSVLGRDITNMFALIVDRPQDAVFMITQRHCYTIVAN